ncbi:hypothetical protein BYT27DRAFT_6815743 [Phlegmacium glaucopus]|nr:hypothetical protein BYT27DRAFT_6815743 [Phlegmacium glaucopus]
MKPSMVLVVSLDRRKVSQSLTQPVLTPRTFRIISLSMLGGTLGTVGGSLVPTNVKDEAINGAGGITSMLFQ